MWTKEGTTMSIPRTGHMSKLAGRTRQNLVRETVKRPMEILNELEENLASAGHSLHVTAVSFIMGHGVG